MTKVNFWTQGELLRADLLKNRIDILSHFIRVAKVKQNVKSHFQDVKRMIFVLKKLFEFNNLNACMAVVMALQSAPIYRLQKTWMVSKIEFQQQHNFKIQISILGS